MHIKSSSRSLIGIDKAEHQNSGSRGVVQSREVVPKATSESKRHLGIMSSPKSRDRQGATPVNQLAGCHAVIIAYVFANVIAAPMIVPPAARPLFQQPKNPADLRQQIERNRCARCDTSEIEVLRKKVAELEARHTNQVRLPLHPRMSEPGHVYLEVDSPLAPELTRGPLPGKVKVPQIGLYYGTADPDAHFGHYTSWMDLHGADDALRCRMFSLTLGPKAQKWYYSLPAESIQYWHQLRSAFKSHFIGANLKDYVARFNEHVQNMEPCHPETLIVSAISVLKPKSMFRWALCQNKPSIFQEFLVRAQQHIIAEESMSIPDLEFTSSKGQKPTPENEKKKKHFNNPSKNPQFKEPFKSDPSDPEVKAARRQYKEDLTAGYRSIYSAGVAAVYQEIKGKGIIPSPTCKNPQKLTGHILPTISPHEADRKPPNEDVTPPSTSLHQIASSILQTPLLDFVNRRLKNLCRSSSKFQLSIPGEFPLSARSDDCPNEERRRPPPSTSRPAGVEKFAVIEQRLSSCFINHHRRPSPPLPVKPRAQPFAVEKTSPVPITVSVEPPSKIPATVDDPSPPPLPIRVREEPETATTAFLARVRRASAPRRPSVSQHQVARPHELDNNSSDLHSAAVCVLHQEIGGPFFGQELPHVLWAYRTTARSSTGETPFSLTYGSEAMIPVELGSPTYRYVNSKLRTRIFKVGDLVLKRIVGPDPGPLKSKWEGPFKISEVLTNGAYQIERPIQNKSVFQLTFCKKAQSALSRFYKKAQNALSRFFN
ncbi:gag-pol polyprotein [Striga asiatica]|uniref:Gag-pol polyprotein n=1 Tax=Striga asiatica TaxID=4170 RepID=A0A5A7P802_STRAF|nr:gag-pol polyprotein [Striga asiatica]